MWTRSWGIITIRLLCGLADQFNRDKKPSMHTEFIGHRLKFHLDDAIHVLKSLDQSNSFVTQPSIVDNNEGFATTRFNNALLASTPANQPEICDQAQIEALIESRIQKVMLGANGHQMSMPSNKLKTPASSRPILRPTLLAPDGSKDCYYCGSPYHVCGDAACATPSWCTQQRRKITESASTDSTPVFH
jgi:hypothetical protein